MKVKFLTKSREGVPLLGNHFGMKHFLLLVCGVFSVSSLFSQVVINELDTDTPGTDTAEFIELKSATPNFPLDGYVLVFMNGGSGASSDVYYTMDLDGLVTDVNGIVLIGSSATSPVPQKYFPYDGVMQNGADAMGIYLGNPSNFPYGSAATSNNLISGLIYETNDPDATALMTALGISVQYDENANGNPTTQSIQRKSDGTYEVKTPTPGANNDGTGVLFNGITVSTNAAELGEGQMMVVTFVAQSPVASNVAISFDLQNGSFSTADYTGLTSVTIPAGLTSVSTNILLIDDTLNEGDEQLFVNVAPLTTGYVRLNTNLGVWVIDNDFTTAAWGTPVNPTYGLVTSTAPAGYYNSLNGKSGAQLKQAIQDIIANPATVHAQNYGDVTDILKEADQNPLNSNQVWLMYVEQPRAKFKFQSTASNTGSWNREHIFPQSRGGFSDGTSSVADGIDNWSTTNANDTDAGHGDAHHIRAEDGPENSSRGNGDYGLNDYNGPAGNLGSWRGDVARALFYMACRYNALSLANGNLPDSTVGVMGDLATLLVWNDLDPADDFEMHHNNVVYTWQNNRNPFVDMPLLASYVYGSNFGQVWNNSLALAEPNAVNVRVYPNPAHDSMTISGLPAGRLEVVTMTGVTVMVTDFVENQKVVLALPAGMYLACIRSGDTIESRKLLIR